ncbi:hypothetical protein B6U91_02375 [Candidatus Pacearchaeota archaeon ex4484_71]|nr:MAG: hypothetical protein B6U91_02375 [Candidatus Pacearchaeota archaeon ex4484_71]
MSFLKKKKRGLRQLTLMAKDYLAKKELKKIKLIKNYEEREDALKHLLEIKLSLDLRDFEEKVGILEKRGEDVSLIKIYIKSLESKIKNYLKFYSRRDFKKILKLRKIIIEEVKNVWGEKKEKK